MSHLTDEQLEEILPEDAYIPEHVSRCAQCSARLAEKRKLARRVRSAFASIQAGPDLADRIRASIGSSGTQIGTAQGRTCTIILSVHRRLWSGLAAAAAIVVLGLLAIVYVDTTSSAQAARTELVAIHQRNLQSVAGLFIHEDPNKLAEYIDSKTGHSPGIPCPKSGRLGCDCCVRRFRGRSAGNYMVRTEAGLVSVIVASDTPESLGLARVAETQRPEPPLWRGHCEGCLIASMRVDGQSYYAIGKVPPTDLDDLLHSLLD